MNKRHPYIIAPNPIIGRYLCNIFNVPTNRILSSVIHLRGQRKNTYLIYTGIELSETPRRFQDMVNLLINLENHMESILIYVPEIERIIR